MKKVALGLLFTVLFVSGCNSAGVNSQSSESSTVETSSKEMVPLNVKQPAHSVDNNTFTIAGTADPEAKVTYTVDNGEENKVKLAKDGSFEISGDLPETNETYRFTDGVNNSPVIVKSKENIVKSKEQNEKERTEREKRQAEEEKKKAEEAAEVQAKAEQERKEQLAKEQAAKEADTSSSTSYSSETTISSSESEVQKEVKKISDDQKALLIAWTQLEGSDRGYDISYGGSSNWNVAVNYINGENRWITTTQDKKLGRVKTIYEWTGNEKDGATLLYLLINGTELVNKLH